MKNLKLLLVFVLLLTSCASGGGSSTNVSDSSNSQEQYDFQGDIKIEENYMISIYGEPDKKEIVSDEADIFWWYSIGTAVKFLSIDYHGDKCISFGMTFDKNTVPDIFYSRQEELFNERF